MSDSIVILIVCVYCAGFLTTWFIAARSWFRRFRPYSSFERVEGGIWALFAAVVWPIVAAGWAMGRLASWLSI